MDRSQVGGFPVRYILELHDWPAECEFEPWRLARPVKRALGEPVPETGERVDFLLGHGQAGSADTRRVILNNGALPGCQTA
jgi:hypothetical protein